jgi:hypothetical protein
MHWRHLVLSTVLTSLASVLLAAPVVWAGGWAVTMLDELPAVIRAGETYPIGYTIRQHGQTRFTSARSGIEIRAAKGGTSQRFAGVAEGAPGHYVAQVRFPEPGEWEWFADQTPFAPQPLGTISVLPLGVAPVPTAASVAQPAPVAVPVAATAGAVSAPQPAVASAAMPSTGSDDPWPAPARLGLPIATALAIALFAWRLVLFVRPTRPPVSRSAAPVR